MNKITLKSILLIGVLLFCVTSITSAQTTLRYTQDIYFGIKNPYITALQTDLSKDSSIYPEKLVTGYFGSLTLKAVKRFQAKYGIRQTGYVGPITRAKLNELFRLLNGQLMSETELKYKLFTDFGRPYSCTGVAPNPEFEREQTNQIFQTIPAMELQVILVHLNLNNVTNFSDSQKLMIVNEYESLTSLQLQTTEGGYSFRYSPNGPNEDIVEGSINKFGTVTNLKKTPGPRRIICA